MHSQNVLSDGINSILQKYCRTFGANTNAVEREIRKKIMTCQFFISYDNRNFYEHLCDACKFNQGAKINYIAGYIYFLSLYEQSEDGRTLDCIWQNQYLSASLIDRTTVNALYANDFLLLLADRQLKRDTMRYIISGVWGCYFAKATCKQNVKLDIMLFMLFFIIHIC